jgi:threonine dehydratase
MDASISIDRIREAANVIDPVFLHSPQYVCEPLSDRLGVTTVLKVESANPIRSFKGRGADYLLHRLEETEQKLVCASAGNFGQGMAFACRSRSVPLTVFAARDANPLKVERMRALGATVELRGDDFDQAKDAAKRHAQDSGELYVEDGRLGAIAEGAGTIAVELTGATELDAIFVPLGNGSLVNGIGTWMKQASPKTRVIAVCAEGAPSMALSWKARKPIDAPSRTIADGIAVRVPVAEAVGIMAGTVDDVVLVNDQAMLEAMRWLIADAGLVIEPAGAAGVAAIAARARDWNGKRVATVLTGGNLTEQQLRDWLYRGVGGGGASGGAGGVPGGRSRSAR